jgi:hypothetical protein
MLIRFLRTACFRFLSFRRSSSSSNEPPAGSFKASEDAPPVHWDYLPSPSNLQMRLVQVKRTTCRSLPDIRRCLSVSNGRSTCSFQASIEAFLVQAGGLRGPFEHPKMLIRFLRTTCPAHPNFKEALRSTGGCLPGLSKLR